MAPIINVHTHYQPESVLEIVKPYDIEMIDKDGAWYFRSGNAEYLLPKSTGTSKFWGANLGDQIPEMDSNGIDINVLQPSPMVFSYHLEPSVNKTFSEAFNDETARHIEGHEDRFWGSAQLPMQDLELAAAELERAVTKLGLKSCSVGYVLGSDRTLADPECDEFLATAARLDVPILLHPVALAQDIDIRAGGAEWLSKYQVDWAWGYLFSETAAVIGLIFGGALDRHPDLRVMVPHGGGMIPYQVGRLRYQGEVFGAKGGSIERDPLDYLNRLYFDTVVHEPASLELLIEVMGPDNVVMGSNYPGWDNAPIWETIKGLDLDDEAKEKVLGRTAAERLFREEV